MTFKIVHLLNTMGAIFFKWNLTVVYLWRNFQQSSKRLREKCITLMNKESEIYGVCRNKTTFYRFCLRNCDPIIGWKGYTKNNLNTSHLKTTMVIVCTKYILPILENIWKGTRWKTKVNSNICWLWINFWSYCVNPILSPYNTSWIDFGKPWIRTVHIFVYW